MKESGCKIENAVAQRFRTNVLNGYWDAVRRNGIFISKTQFLTEQVLSDIKALQVHLARNTDYIEMKFMVLEQKFLEQLERGAVSYIFVIHLLINTRLQHKERHILFL
jgi:hypothetical protein